MNPIASQQAALDNSLVAPEKRLKIERCNARIVTKPQKKKHTKEYLLTFIKELGYSGKCDMLSTIPIDQMHHPWRTFVAFINRCISGKSTGLDRLRESRAQVLWTMYNQNYVDYVALLWEDFMYQADNREISSARKKHMPYPRFTKVIIGHFISKDNSISMRNIINLHTAHDDSLLAYKTYLDYATGKVPPKKARKFKKSASPKLKIVLASPKEPTQKGKRVKRPAKKATTAPINRGKGIELLSDAALLEDAQLKKTLRKSKRETHKLQASGSSEGVNFESKGKSEDENDDFNDEDDDGGNDDNSGSNDDGDNDAQDSEQTDSNDYENPFFTLKDYKE
ncbi:hypothetical protein Tco_0058202 [Tanacetum coccineum]